MKYPKSLRIGDRVYRIRFVKLIRKDKNTLGLFDPSRLEILIAKDQSPDETLKTFLHEIHHGFEFEYDIKIRHRDIYRLEEAYFDFICANSEAFYK